MLYVYPLLLTNEVGKTENKISYFSSIPIKGLGRWPVPASINRTFCMVYQDPFSLLGLYQRTRLVTPSSSILSTCSNQSSLHLHILSLIENTPNAAHTRSIMLRKIVLRNTSLPIHDQVNRHHTRSIMLHNTQCCAMIDRVWAP
jgi:hypothetical protein